MDVAKRAGLQDEQTEPALNLIIAMREAQWHGLGHAISIWVSYF